MKEKNDRQERKLGCSKRRQQRQCIIECLYMWNMQPEVAVETLFNDYCEEKSSEIETEILKADFVIACLNGVVNHTDFLDGKIKRFAKNWSFDRIAKIDLAILRLALYELCFCKETPVPIVINEAIELSKIYSSDDSKRFINGILDHVAKEDLKNDI